LHRERKAMPCSGTSFRTSEALPALGIFLHFTASLAAPRKGDSEIRQHFCAIGEPQGEIIRICDIVDLTAVILNL
jgi:hypothetical protein